MWFQSHVGSISTKSRCLQLLLLLMFQSHVGSISTNNVSTPAERFARCFNPTLVRLAPRIDSPSLRSFVCFNPTLVRLAPTRNPCSTWARIPRFNPTLVRLARKLGESIRAAVICFNPTLVRLARCAVSVAIKGDVQFQSHVGSIST